jgi:hypothetical protein
MVQAAYWLTKDLLHSKPLLETMRKPYGIFCSQKANKTTEEGRLAKVKEEVKPRGHCLAWEKFRVSETADGKSKSMMWKREDSVALKNEKDFQIEKE